MVFQFAASLFLLMGTVTVYQQIQYMRKQSLGINIDQTLVTTAPTVGIDSTYLKKITAFKQELQQHSSIHNITVSTSIPGEAVGWNAGGIKLVGTDESTQKQYRVIGVDYDYIKTYELKLIAGSAFSKEFGSDNHSVIFNRKGIEQLGFNKPGEALGKKIDFWGQQYTIEGVTENFHQQSLREAYEPLILRLIPDVNGYLSVKTDAARANKTIAVVKAQWNKFFPETHSNIFSSMIILMNNIKLISVLARCSAYLQVLPYWLRALDYLASLHLQHYNVQKKLAYERY